jgi:photosystem II stability/assembly factor-like uncharacterized protein
MKKKFLVLLSFAIQINLSGQLKWLNPTPSGWTNTKIHFTSSNTGYLMNYNGNLFVTADTGNTWQLLGNFSGARTFKIQQSIGLIPAFDTSIYLSTDSGVSWYKSANSPGGNLVSDWCDIVGSDTLFVQRYNNNFVTSLYKSVNRGTSWQLINNNINQFYFNSIDFITSQKGYALWPNGILRTSDGGLTWQEIYTELTSANVICMKFFDSLRGLAYRESFGMLRTIDGGATWTLSNQVTEDIYDIFYSDSLTVYASGDNGAAFRSTDGGSNWTWIGPNGLVDGYDIFTQYFFNANEGIVSGQRGRLLKTRTGGTSWEWYSPTYINVTDISFGNDSIGYATTWNNIYKTSNKGTSWGQLSLTTAGAGINSRFDHCVFFSGDTGIVSTNFPIRVYKTYDGGQNWATSLFLSPQYDYISSISFINKDTGYAAIKGTINGLFKTTNGGNSWQEVGSFQNFTLLHFINNTFGYATLFDNIFRTTDAGLSWTQLTQPTFQPYNAIWFVNPAKGFATGNQGLLKMTLDSGNSWTNINVPVPVGQPDFTAIRFYNQKIGYISDDEGYYYKTIDSGYHWSQKEKIANNECRSILFRPDTTAVLAGIYGTIVNINIAEYGIDSVQIIPGVCSAVLKAKISSFLSPVDSIWFEYGKNIYTSLISANPNSVNDTSLFVTATLNNLMPDSVYHARVKILFKGNYYYSTDFVFIPKKQVAPVITASGNVLTSSASSGNQWYLNGTLIGGATNQQYTATVSGAYTVITTQGVCTSPPSAIYNLTITSLPNITSWNNDLKIFPNPITTNYIYVEVSNNRRLLLQISDIHGRIVKEQLLKKGVNLVGLAGFQQAIYLFIISDTRTLEKVQRKILKI